MMRMRRVLMWLVVAASASLMQAIACAEGGGCYVRCSESGSGSCMVGQSLSVPVGGSVVVPDCARLSLGNGVAEVRFKVSNKLQKVRFASGESFEKQLKKNKIRAEEIDCLGFEKDCIAAKLESSPTPRGKQYEDTDNWSATGDPGSKMLPFSKVMPDEKGGLQFTVRDVPEGARFSFKPLRGAEKERSVTVVQDRIVLSGDSLAPGSTYRYALLAKDDSIAVRGEFTIQQSQALDATRKRLAAIPSGDDAANASLEELLRSGLHWNALQYLQSTTPAASTGGL